MCGVSHSSYNERKRAEKKNQEHPEEMKKEESVKKLMRSVVKKLGYVPGECGFKTFLWKDHDLNVGRKRIKQLMREMNLFASDPNKGCL